MENFFGLEQATSYLDIRLALILNVVGIAIKQSRLFNRVENKNNMIPFTLIVLGTIISVSIKRDFSYDAILTGIISGTFAVGGWSALAQFIKNFINKPEEDIKPVVEHNVIIETEVEPPKVAKG